MSERARGGYPAEQRAWPERPAGTGASAREPGIPASSERNDVTAAESGE